MKDLNLQQFTGRLGVNPEMRFTPQGKSVCNFRVASNRSWNDSAGQKQEVTEWFSCVAWDKLAELCNQILQKGSKVYIQGRTQTRSWKDSTSGEQRYKTEVIVEEMIALDNRVENGGASNAGGRPAANGPDLGDDDIPF